jgi:lipopolysaccharide/colanic/teichoic acid biosynthesis glycosyltransferase
MKITTFTPLDTHAVSLEIPVAPNRYLPIKRVLDVVVSLLLMVLFAPFILLIGLGIRITSPCPVFYRQMRIGKNGKLFRMLKFRTMWVDTTPDLHREYVQTLIKENTQPRDLGRRSLKLAGDPRVTGIGKYLRKFGLDELPQLFNVLKGDMSIVGPRPALDYEDEVYDEWHRQRVAVLPGITGLWQVTARNTVAFDDMVQMDIFYIEHMDLWLDLKIMLLTPVEMILGRGAA